jgi:hypothetical protein
MSEKPTSEEIPFDEYEPYYDDSDYQYEQWLLDSPVADTHDVPW